MRIVIDFQAAQTGSRFRGIGGYATDLVKAIIRESKDHEFFLVLNGLFPETIEPVRAEFDSILPQSQIRVWYAPGIPDQFTSPSQAAREMAEIVREYFIRSLEPDLILLTSMFEGLGDSAVVTVKEYVKDIPSAAIFYDLTPLLLPDEYFATNLLHRRWYRHRIRQLRRCDVLFAISESSKKEVIEELNFPETQVINILGGVGEGYRQLNLSDASRSDLLRRYGITKPFILYAGGVERNKNLSTLIAALANLSPQIKRDYQFVAVGNRKPGEAERIRAMAVDSDSKSMIYDLGFVPQQDLVKLYNTAALFVFPSLREGLGLPPLEAMACGAPTIVSNMTSLPEVVNNSEALFDPTSPVEIANKISDALLDSNFRSRLVKSGVARATELTWQASAAKVLSTLETRFAARRPLDTSRRSIVMRTSQFKADPLRILGMKLDHNGDFLLSIPAMAKLRARYPDARIDVVVGSWSSMAAEASKLFDRVYTLDFFKGQSSARPSLDEAALNRLLQEMPYYDFAIDFRRQPETRFILVKFNADRYFGYKSNHEAIDVLLTDPIDVHPEDQSIRGYFDESHICEHMLRIVDILPFGMRDYLTLPALGERREVKPGSVAIFPRVGLDARQWDSARFAALIDSLARRPEVSEVNLYVGRSEDLAIIPYSPSDRIRVHAGLNFSELFSSLSSNDVCVGNNSFGVHLGGYAGCRTIAIYSGHELPQQWGPPFGDSVAITIDAPCAPCHLPDRESCPFDMMCLNDISVQTIESAIIDAISGKPLAENYSRITLANPASAIKPLMDTINKSKFLGRIDGLTADARIALAAAISVNFPERASPQRCIFFDVSGLLVPELLARSNRRYREIQEIIGVLRKSVDGVVVPIATAQHDHEFYSIDLRSIDESLFDHSRYDRIVRPVAGDVYVGIHTYLKRNAAQWNLLAAWRQMGVFTILGAPEGSGLANVKSAANCDRELASYLFTIGHFDAVLTDSDCTELRNFIDEFGPPRLREVACSRDLLDLIPSTPETSSSANTFVRSNEGPPRAHTPGLRRAVEDVDGSRLSTEETT